MCVLIFFSVQLLPEIFVTVRTEKDIIMNGQKSLCKGPFSLVRF